VPNLDFPSAEIVATPRTNEWYTHRRSGIGASEAASAVGLDPRWGTPLSLWRRKMGLDPEPEDNIDIITGRMMEPTIIRIFRAVTNIRVQTRRPPMYRSKEWPFMTATPDAITTQPDLIECKNTNVFDASDWGQEGTDEIPNTALCQVQHQMAVTGLTLVWVPVLIRGRFRCYKVPRNDRFISELVDQEREFWRLIQEDRQPDPDWQHPSTPSLIRSMFGIDPAKTVDFSGDEEAQALWQSYEQNRDIERDGKECAEIDRAKFLMKMKEASAALLGDGTMVRRAKITTKEHLVKESERLDIRRVKVPR
jgi:putative phage-type endonuclease